MNNSAASRAFSVLALLASVVLVVLGSLRCWKPVPVPARDGGPTAGAGGVGGAGDAGGGGTAAGGGMGATGGSGGAGAAGGCGGSSPACIVTLCGLAANGCGDCVDNDDDGLVDSEDPECLGACDRSENALHFTTGGLAPSCSVDCSFDWDLGHGNDACYWDHECDPLEVPPDYPPEGILCAYDPNGNAGPGLSCSDGMTAQAPECLDFCLPLVPNGCDCFGCCELPAGGGSHVWINSEDTIGYPTCEIEHATDPTKCKPCTPVPSCINPCEDCELCLGKPDLDPGCGDEQVCPAGRQRCGLPCQPGCPEGEYCLTGCCVPAPQ